jgi:hypothetical protein
MTPKEKAEELVNKFMNIKSLKLSDYSKIYHPTAKKCALITIDDILKSPSKVDWINEKDINFKPFFNYWKKVKQEIKKL